MHIPTTHGRIVRSPLVRGPAIDIAVEVGLPVPPTTRRDLDSRSSSGAPPHIRMTLIVNEAVIDMAGADSLHLGCYFMDALSSSDPDGGDFIKFGSAVVWGWQTLA